MAEIKVPRHLQDRINGEKIIVYLADAPLEVVKVKETFQLANADEHKNLLNKEKRTIADMRPDILHQCLLSLLDSPLNKAGKLLIFIHTTKNVLIEVNPQLRIPRTFKRFCGLFVELLMKQKIRSADGSSILLKIIANPVTNYLPPRGRKVGFSVKGTLTRLSDYIHTMKEVQPIDDTNGVTGASKRRRLLGLHTATSVVPMDTQLTLGLSNAGEREGAFSGPPTFVIGAVAHTDPASNIEWLDECIAISQYGLSAACCCAKLTNEFEEIWGVL